MLAGGAARAPMLRHGAMAHDPAEPVRSRNLANDRFACGGQVPRPWLEETVPGRNRPTQPSDACRPVPLKGTPRAGHKEVSREALTAVAVMPLG